jgi:hypothetical protein
MPVLTPVRQTPDGQVVLAGTFLLVDTFGVPLPDMLDALVRRGCIPCWLDFYRSAVDAGWSARGTQVKISEAVGDVFGAEYREAFDVRFSEVVQTLEVSDED